MLRRLNFSCWNDIVFGVEEEDNKFDHEIYLINFYTISSVKILPGAIQTCNLF
jgi:hypothetical protein